MLSSSISKLNANVSQSGLSTFNNYITGISNSITKLPQSSNLSTSINNLIGINSKDSTIILDTLTRITSGITNLTSGLKLSDTILNGTSITLSKLSESIQKMFTTLSNLNGTDLSNSIATIFSNVNSLLPPYRS
jgi:hypothetical protein